MLEDIEVSDVIPARAKQVYLAWLDSSGHSQMTGDPATIDGRVGGEFSAGDGYIRGRTLELEPFRRIVQAWRTTEFPEGSVDSRLEITLEEVKGGTKVTLRHTGLPEGQGESYHQGWIDYYFKPMKAYFRASKA
jgi:activator of HSP90 ATPase